MCKDNPLQPRHRSPAPALPQEPSSTLVSAARTADGPLPSASPGCRPLIQELEEQLAEELNISQDLGDTAEGPGPAAGGALLEPSPRRNLLISTTQEDECDT